MTTPRRATLATVAEALGVSAMTVSNAYNRPEKLSAELRERIMATAAELGYAGPDPTARSLRRGRAGALGVVLGEQLPYAFEDPGAVEFLRGLAGASADAGIALHLVPARGADGDPELVLGAAVDAFVLFALPAGHPLVDAVLRRGLPTVVQSSPALPDVPLVGIDDAAAAAAAARHVAGLGHRRIGVLSMPLGDGERGDRAVCATAHASHGVTAGRLAGYVAGAPGPLSVREVASNDRAHGEAAAGVLLDAPEPPTALLCMSDELALGALAAAAARGVEVPRELSVVGFDDVGYAAGADPPLTTIRQDLREQGRLCAELAGGTAPPGPRVRVQPWELIVRGSTAPPA